MFPLLLLDARTNHHVCILQMESPPCLHRLSQCLTHVFFGPVWRDWLVKLGTNVAEGLCPLKRNILWSARGWMSLQIEMHLGVSMGGNNVQQWYLWSLLELPSTGTVSSVVIINPFLFPQHKSFHGSFIPCARTGFQKQFQLKNKVLFFNFRAICIRVSVVYLAGILVFTYLFKGKKKKRGPVWFMDRCKSAIFYVVHLIWEGMEKGHIDHTNTMALPQRVGGYSFFLKKRKKKCQLGLIYDMQSKQRSTTPLFFEPCFWANVMEKQKKEEKKEHSVPLLWSLITHKIDINLFVCNPKTIKAAGWVTKIKKIETVGNG